MNSSADETLYVVRLYDGFDNQWIDITGPLVFRDALVEWLHRTENGTEKICYDDIDYFWIFPADTKMLYSDGFGER